MATGAQLDEFDELEEEHERNVKAVQEETDRALLRAGAQLAAAIAGEANAVADITQRDGFDPDTPDSVLTISETIRLAEACLVVGALRDYVTGTLRIQNAHGPRVSGGGVSPGWV